MTGLDVARLGIGAEIFDHLIGLEHVGSRSGCPTQWTHLPAHLRQLGQALLLLALVEARPQIFIAMSLFLSWLRSFWHVTTIQVGLWRMRIAVSTFCTF